MSDPFFGLLGRISRGEYIFAYLRIGVVLDGVLSTCSFFTLPFLRGGTTNGRTNNTGDGNGVLWATQKV